MGMENSAAERAAAFEIASASGSIWLSRGQICRSKGVRHWFAL